MLMFQLLKDPLILSLIGVLIVSSIAAARVRNAAAVLPLETRDRIAQFEHKMSFIWRSTEWTGLGLIFLAQFLPQMVLFTADSQRVITLAVGLMLFGSGNTCAGWFSYTIYKREAAGTDASRASLTGAILVTLAESVLLSVIVWVVSTRLDLTPSSTSGRQSNETTAQQKDDSANWIDESLLKKELAGIDHDYIQGMVDSGALRTKKIGDKTLYRLSDVQKLKNKSKDAFE